MVFLDFFKRKDSDKKTTDFAYDEAVILHIDLEDVDDLKTQQQFDAVQDLEQAIVPLLPERSGIDGDEFGEGECILYVYGPSADVIFSSIKTELERSPFRRIDVTLQYGRPEDFSAKEKSFTL